jgi:heme exporter protein A
MYSQSFSVSELCGARGDLWLFEGLSFSLQPGEALLIRGANGAGKSTLLRILSGLLSPADGSISYGTAGAEPPPLHFLGHANAIKLGLTVEQNASFWAAFAGVPATEQQDAIDAALEAFNLDALRDMPARYLSAGQKRRLALSRLTASPAPLWLLDEPATALDTASTALFERAVAAHRARGGMAVIATHQELSVPDAQALTLEARR